MLNSAQIDKLWNFDNPSESEERFRETLAQLRPGTAVYAEVLTQIARTYSLRGHFEHVHAMLDEAEAQIKTDWVRQKVRLWLERGRTYNSADQQDMALSYFQQAWELASTLPGEAYYAIDAAHMLAIVESPNCQLAWNLKALELAEQTTDERAQKWRASLYNNIGWTHHDRQEFALALDCFNKGLALRQQQGNASNIRIARWSVARVLRSLGRLDEALATQRQLLAEFEQLGEGDGYVFEEIGECLLALGRAEEANPSFALAFEELSKDGYLVKHESVRLDRLRLLGGLILA